MKKIIYILETFVIAFMFVNCYAQLPNSWVQSGTFSYWRGYYGHNTNGTLNLSTFTEGFISYRLSIVTPGTEPVVNSPFFNKYFEERYTPNDTFSIKLGNDSAQSQADIVSYRCKLLDGLGFYYQLVMQNAHDSLHNPFFCYWISLGDNLVSSMNPGNLLAYYRIPASNSSFFSSTAYLGQPLKYREWTRECIIERFPNLVNYFNDSVTIYFASADCSQTGHFGYAYIDYISLKPTGIAKFQAPFTFGAAPSQPLTVDGRTSLGEDGYYWTIQPCDASGTVLPGSAPLSLGSFANPYYGMVGVINLKSLGIPANYFQAGQYYKVTLATTVCMGYLANPGETIDDTYSRVLQAI